MEDGTIKAAIERLEQERERLIAEKIEKGLAVRASPLVVGSPDEIDAARAREIAALREAGETREIVFGDGEIEVIITGVPRSARGQVQAHNVSYPDTENSQRRPEGEALRLREDDPLRATFAAPVPEPTPSDPIAITVQIRAPDEREPAGVIARGSYRHTDTKVRVYDERGDLLGGADLRPGDNVEAAAKKLLREKHGGGRFYHPINYPRRSLH
jgi:hypothetical protein